MSFVSTEIFVPTISGLEQRVGAFEARLHELFSKVETKFGQQQNQIHEIGVKVTAPAGQVSGCNGELSQMPGRINEQVKNLLQEQQHGAQERFRYIEQINGQTHAGVQQINEVLGGLRSEVNVVQHEVSTSAGHSGGGGKRSLIDPKTFKFKICEGAENESRQVWEDWREDMDDYLNQFHKDIKPILEQAARWKRDIDEAEFTTVVNSAGIQFGQLTWSYSIVEKELSTFIKDWLQEEHERSSAAVNMVVSTATASSLEKSTRSTTGLVRQ